MRNLKRALSMAMASVMLMGMSVVGTGAANVSDFSDVDSINNLEAVSIATGLGIFDGYDDGEFKPEKVVTRAEMAVVIAKILHGADVDPNTFVGDSKFTDVPAWAEGYVNLVASLGIIEGYGDGKFGPNDPVTTVQANIMLLKALGYYTAEGDNLPGNWADAQLAATSKATALGFFGDKSLKMDQGLTREDVAELTFNALFAQRVAYDDVRGLHVKANNRNVVVTNGTKDEYNTLAENTFGLYAVDGLVVENGTTNIDLEGKTRVVFEEAKDVTGDGKVETEYNFEVISGLDMIGHATTVYYKIVKKAPVVYAAVDQATLVAVTTPGTNLSASAKKVGFDRDTSDTKIVYNYDLTNEITADAAYSAAHKDDAVILVSNSADLTVDYAIVVDQTLDFVKKVAVNTSDADNHITTYTLEELGAKTEENDIVVLGDVELNDYVLVTMIEGRGTNGGDLYVVKAAETENETIVKVTRKLDDTTKLASAGVEYKESAVIVPEKVQTAGSTIKAEYVVTPYEDVLSKGEYVLIYDEFFGKLIGVAPVKVDDTINTAYVAQFGYKINTDPSLNDAYALTAHVYFADGTNGVYYVDTKTKTVDGNAFEGRVTNDNKKWQTYLNGVKTDEDEVAITKAAGAMNAVDTYDKAEADDGAYGVSGAYIGLYNVSIQENGKVLIEDLKTPVAADELDYVTNVEKGVTYMGDLDGDETDATTDKQLYGTSNTVTFFVDGMYDEYATNYGLTVGVVKGMANLPAGLTLVEDNVIGDLVYNDEDQGAVAQAYYTTKTGYLAADATLVAGYELYTAIDGIYFYNGVYSVSKNAETGKWDLDIQVYDNATAEPKTISYTGYTTDAAARQVIKNTEIGFYRDSGKKDAPLATYANTSTDDANGLTDKGAVVYAHSSKFDHFTERGDILTLYTAANKLAGGVTATETPVIDLTDNGITSLEELAEVIAARKEVYKNAGATGHDEYAKTAMVSYSYNEDKNVADFIYITDVIDPYTKDYTQNTPADVFNAKLLAESFDGMALTVNYVAGKEVPVQQAKAYLESLGYKLSSYTVSEGTGTAVVLYDGVELTVAVTENIWVESVVNGKVVGYTTDAEVETEAVVISIADLKGEADGYIVRTYEYDEDTEKWAWTEWEYVDADEDLTMTGKMEVKTGYFDAADEFEVTCADEGYVTTATATTVGYVQKNGSLKITVAFTELSDAEDAASDVVVTLKEGDKTLKTQEVKAAKVAEDGYVVEFTVSGIDAEVEADTFTITVADKTEG